MKTAKKTKRVNKERSVSFKMETLDYEKLEALAKEKSLPVGAFVRMVLVGAISKK